MTPILAESGGRVRFEDIIEGETLRKERDASGAERCVIMEHKGDLHPQIVIEDDRGQSLEAKYIPGTSHLEVRDGQRSWPARCSAKTPREVAARRTSPAVCRASPKSSRPAGRATPPSWPRSPAGSASASKTRQAHHHDSAGGRGRQVDRRGQASTWCRTASTLRVHTGDYVKAGDPLVDGPLVPHDILRISGIEAVQNYLVREVQSVYRSQRVDIDDKHIEIIVAQMLRKVKVETMGDTGLLPGSVMDKFAFREVNDRLMRSA